jgi:hypothetical protein
MQVGEQAATVLADDRLAIGVTAGHEPSEEALAQL